MGAYKTCHNCGHALIRPALEGGKLPKREPMLCRQHDNAMKAQRKNKETVNGWPVIKKPEQGCKRWFDRYKLKDLPKCKGIN